MVLGPIPLRASYRMGPNPYLRLNQMQAYSKEHDLYFERCHITKWGLEIPFVLFGCIPSCIKVWYYPTVTHLCDGSFVMEWSSKLNGIWCGDLHLQLDFGVLFGWAKFSSDHRKLGPIYTLPILNKTLSKILPQKIKEKAKGPRWNPPVGVEHILMWYSRNCSSYAFIFCGPGRKLRDLN